MLDLPQNTFSLLGRIKNVAKAPRLKAHVQKYLGPTFLRGRKNLQKPTKLVSCIFILLSRESDQCAIRARLRVASRLSTTPRWGNPAKCLSQRHNK